MRVWIGFALLVVGAAGARQARSQDAKPLPPVAELRARAAENYRKTSEARERYICKSKVTEQELDGKGQVKKTTVLEREVFYVHGQEISQRVSTNGKPLTPDEIRKRDENVRKAIETASAGKRVNNHAVNVNDILKLAKLGNERRILVSGRPTIVFDVVPDPDAKTNDMAQRFVADMAGTVSIDELTGTLQDANTRGVKDVKILGGLAANVHKGFALHVIVAPQPDGVWLLTLVEGKGDARVGLFVHEGGQFRQETQGCQLYGVSAGQAGDAVRGAK